MANPAVDLAGGPGEAGAESAFWLGNFRLTRCSVRTGRHPEQLTVNKSSSRVLIKEERLDSVSTHRTLTHNVPVSRSPSHAVDLPRRMVFGEQGTIDFGRHTDDFQVEPLFSPRGKEVLTTLIDFVQVT